VPVFQQNWTFDLSIPKMLPTPSTGVSQSALTWRALIKLKIISTQPQDQNKQRAKNCPSILKLKEKKNTKTAFYVFLKE